MGAKGENCEGKGVSESYRRVLCAGKRVRESKK